NCVRCMSLEIDLRIASGKEKYWEKKAKDLEMKAKDDRERADERERDLLKLIDDLRKEF
ncbi:unnamed protein product, partial [Didymodactylos carnosus]